MTTRRSFSASRISTATEAELLEELDEVVARACAGDSSAVLSVSLAFGPTLLKEARAVLGELFHQDAGDVVQDFTVALLEGEELQFPRIRGAALPWMKRTVRRFAAIHLGKRTRDLGDAG